MPPKPMKDREVTAAATRVMGRPSKHLGVTASSTRRRTPENRTMATRKPMPAPAAQTMLSAKS